MLSVTLLLAGAGAAVAVLVSDGAVGGAVACLSMMGWWLVATRLFFHRVQPDRILMTDTERAGLRSLLGLTAVVFGTGFVAVIALALAGVASWVAWLPIWPAVALGLLCGARSLTQLASTTRAARREA